MALAKHEPNPNIVEEFEEAFQSVCKYLEQIDEKKPSSEDIKKNAEVLVNRFANAGRACEQFFLQRHIQVADAKPEQVLRDECNELRQEINKKDAAIVRHHESLKNWQQTLKSGVSSRNVGQKSQQSRGIAAVPSVYTMQSGAPP